MCMYTDLCRLSEASLDSFYIPYAQRYKSMFMYLHKISFTLALM